MKIYKIFYKMHDSNKNELRPTISTRQLPKAVPQSRKIIYQRQSVRDEALREWKQKLEQQRKKQQQLQSKGKTLWEKCTQCITKIFQCRKHQNTVRNSIQVKTEDLIQTIKTLRDEKLASSQVLLPQLKQNLRTIVLDLDGTLLFTSRHMIPSYNIKSRISSTIGNFTLYAKFRPGALRFLQQLSEKYQLVLFTSSPKQVVKVILKSMGKRLFRHILYRDKCICLNQMYYLKDLRMINRNLSTTISIDCNVATGVLQPQNFFQISHYYGSEDDNELEQVSSFLSWVHSKQSIIPISKHYEEYYCSKYVDIDDSKNSASIRLLIPRKHQKQTKQSIFKKVMSISFIDKQEDQQNDKESVLSDISHMCQQLKNEMKETNFTENNEIKLENQVQSFQNNPYRTKRNGSTLEIRHNSEFQMFRAKIKLRKTDSSSSSIMKGEQA